LRQAHPTGRSPPFLAELCRRRRLRRYCLDVQQRVRVDGESTVTMPRRLSGCDRASAIGEIHPLPDTICARSAKVRSGYERSRLRRFGQVWALYEHTLALIGPRPTLIEWTSRPAGRSNTLLTEARKAQTALAARHEARGLQAAYRNYLLTGG